MNNKLKSDILERYLSAYRGLVEAEQVEADTVVVSFPFHVWESHRVELAIQKISNVEFFISDMARTIGELKLNGYNINKSVRAKIQTLGQDAGIRVKQNELVRSCSPSELGNVLQKFAEAAKTIGDAYLVHKTRPISEDRLFGIVKESLDYKGIAHEERVRVSGVLDSHTIDFYAPPNGKPGFGIAILARQDTHTLAQLWGFKCRDLRDAHPNLKIGLVYDTEDAKWTQIAENIIRHEANFVLPSTSAADAADRAIEIVS